MKTSAAGIALIKEQWRPVPGCEPLEVTECGRVRRPAFVAVFTRKGVQLTQARKAVEYAPYKTANGYLEIQAKTEGARQKHLVHRLVGLAWVPGYQDGLTINHLDGDKFNNRASNLEWVTVAENTKHQWRTGLVDLRGANHPNSKLNEHQIRLARSLHRRQEGRFGLTSELARAWGVTPGLLHMAIKGQRWASVVG